jgi:hypothetical protein
MKSLTASLKVAPENAQLRPTQPHDPNRYVDDALAAELLGMSCSWLRQLRVAGGGCRYARFGRSIRYRVGDLLEWASSRTVSSTSEQSAGADRG